RLPFRRRTVRRERREQAQTRRSSERAVLHADATYVPPPLRAHDVSCRCETSCRPLLSRAHTSLGCPVEGDAEGEDRDRGDHALPELVPLQTFGNLVAEPARPDEAGDDDDGEHHDDSL